MGTTLTIRIDEKTKQRLECLAAAMARSKSYLVSTAINEFIEANEWQIREIKKAVTKADQPDGEHSRFFVKMPLAGRGRNSNTSFQFEGKMPQVVIMFHLQHPETMKMVL